MTETVKIEKQFLMEIVELYDELGESYWSVLDESNHPEMGGYKYDYHAMEAECTTYGCPTKEHAEKLCKLMDKIDKIREMIFRYREDE